MKKLLFIANYGSKYGGAPTSLLHLISDIKNNYDISVMMPDNGELSDLLSHMNIKIEISKFRIRYIFGLAHKIYKGKYDLIYANGFHYRPILVLVISKLINIPFIWHIREVLDSKKNAQAKWIKYANLIIANSNATANSLSKIASKEKIKVVMNGININEFIYNNKNRIKIREYLNIPIDSIVVCNIGRIGKQKNQSEVISIASELKNSPSNLHYIFVGHHQDDAYMQLMMQKVYDLNLQSKIHFVGHRSNVADYLSASDILIHTSREESQGRVILEAMASRIPIIAYDVGGIHESLINRETGILVPFGRKDLLLEELKIMIQDEEKRKVYGNNGLNHVQNFSSQITSNQISRLIKNSIR